MRTKPALIRASFTAEGGIQSQRTVRIDELKSVRRRDELPQDQADRAKALWNRFGRYLRPEIDEAEWVDGFCFDMDPVGEMSKLEQIADLTDDLWHHPRFDKFTRIGLAKTVNAVLMGVVDVPALLDGVTDETADLVKARWTMTSIRQGAEPPKEWYFPRETIMAIDDAPVIGSQDSAGKLSVIAGDAQEGREMLTFYTDDRDELDRIAALCIVLGK